MELDATERLRNMGINKYEAVIAVAKHARRLNLERLRGKTEEEPASDSSDKLPKIITQALKDVLAGKVEFERPNKT